MEGKGRERKKLKKIKKTLDKSHRLCYNKSVKRKELISMAKVKMVCFDMDGTIADLYGVNNWLDQLREFNPNPYRQARPMWDMNELNMVLEQLQVQGIEIRVISWLSMESTKEYDQQVRQAKIEWLQAQGFNADHIHLVKYGTTKASCVRRYLAENEYAILVDDNDQVRNGWSLGDTINPTTENIIEILKALL